MSPSDLFLVAASLFAAPTSPTPLSFYYCGQNVDIFTQGIYATDLNQTAGRTYNVQFSENSNFNPFLSYTYPANFGGPGGPYIGTVAGMKPGKTYFVRFRFQDGLNPNPHVSSWSMFGPPCSFNTIVDRQFNYCQPAIDMSRCCHSNGIDIHHYGVTATDLGQRYNYYRYEFSSTSSAFLEHVDTSAPISQILSKELTPVTGANGGPYISSVPGIRRGCAYYVRTLVRQATSDPWVPGPVCTFAAR